MATLYTAKQAAEKTGIPRSTINWMARRHGRGKRDETPFGLVWTFTYDDLRFFQRVRKMRKQSDA